MRECQPQRGGQVSGPPDGSELEPAQVTLRGEPDTYNTTMEKVIETPRILPYWNINR